MNAAARNALLTLGFMLHLAVALAQPATYDAAKGTLSIPMVTTDDATYINLMLRNTGGYHFALEQVTDCSGFKRLASPAELSQTPRPSQEAEVLAIEASGAFVAPQAVYDRVIRDLANIRSNFAEARNINATGWVPDQMIVLLDEAGSAAVREGRYFHADCLNAIYGAKRFVRGTTGLLYVVITFSGRFNIPLLAAEYAKLPGVMHAGPNFVTDLPDVCLSIEGETFYYIFDEAWGDCMSGCINHIYQEYSTDSAGNITPSPAVSSQQRAACIKWL